MCDQQRLRPACAYAQSDQSCCKSIECSMTLPLLIEHHLEFLSLKRGCTDSSESTFVKMPHCWKSHVTAQMCFQLQLSYILLCFQTLRYSCHISCYVFRHYATVVIYPVMFSDITLQLSYILLCFQTLRYSCHIFCYVFRHYATVVIYFVMFSDITLQLSYILLCFQTLSFSCHISCYVFRHSNFSYSPHQATLCHLSMLELSLKLSRSTIHKRYPTVTLLF